ncbi:MAG: hypothetical protein WC788_02510 [Candidatus Paceibacterota bacterium]|jgi:hypothetical protein
MSSINLLPENFIKKKKETLAESQNRLPMLLSFLMIALSIFAMSYLYVQNLSWKERIDLTKKEAEKVDKELDEAVKGNELLTLENTAKDVNTMLSDQPYFTEVFYYLQGKLTENVYATSINIEAGEDGVPISLSLIAKDYLSISDQLYIFKSDPLVESVVLGGMQSGGDGSIGFSLSLVVKKSIIQINGEDDQK